LSNADINPGAGMMIYRVKALIAALSLVFLSLSLSAQINVRNYSIRGRQHLMNNEYTEAIRLFNQIIYYKPDHADSYFYRGLAKYQLSDYSGAERDFTRAIELKSYKTEAMYYRAVVNIEKGNNVEALKDLITAIELDNRHPEYFLTRGWLHAEFGDTLGAISDYKTAIRLDEYMDNAYLNLSVIYMLQKNYEDALINCNKAAEIKPRNLACNLTRGNIYHYSKRYLEAISEYKTVIRGDSTSVRAHFFLALCYQDVRSYDSAIVEYNKALVLNPNNSICYYNRGILNLDLEEYNDALMDFDNVIQLNPRNIYSYYLRGIIKSNLEDYPGAEEDFTTAIDLYPKLINAYRNRAYTRMSQNDQKGYDEDQRIIDSLMKIQVPEHETDELSYLQTITDFNNDFTSISNVIDSKVQYADKEIRMIPVFHIAVKQDWDLYGSSRFNGLVTLDQLGEKNIYFKVDNYDYGIVDEKIVSGLAYKFDSVLQIDETDNEYYLVKSLLLGWQMKYRDAIKIIDEAEIDIADNHLTYFIRGNHQFAIGEIIYSIENQEIFLNSQTDPSSDDGQQDVIQEYYRFAIEDYNRAVELNPGFIYARFNRAYVKSLQENFQEAVEEYSYCLEKDQDFAQAYYNRGLLYIYMEDPSKGCVDLSKAGELGIQSAYQVIYKFCNN
jgi:tetratricopeptide (TPR) repeat protein